MNPIILLFAPAPITVTKDLYNLKRVVIIHGLVLIRSISLKSILSYPYKSRPDLILKKFEFFLHSNLKLVKNRWQPPDQYHRTIG